MPISSSLAPESLRAAIYDVVDTRGRAADDGEDAESAYRMVGSVLGKISAAEFGQEKVRELKSWLAGISFEEATLIVSELALDERETKLVNARLWRQTELEIIDGEIRHRSTLATVVDLDTLTVLTAASDDDGGVTVGDDVAATGDYVG